MPPVPPEHLAGMEELQPAHPVLLTLALLNLLMTVSALALQGLRRLSLPSQKIQACPMQIILPNRHRRSWRVLVSRKPGSQMKAQSRIRNGRTSKPSAVMRARSTFKEQEKKPEERGIG